MHECVWAFCECRPEGNDDTEPATLRVGLVSHNPVLLFLLDGLIPRSARLCFSPFLQPALTQLTTSARPPASPTPPPSHTITTTTNDNNNRYLDTVQRAEELSSLAV